MSNTSDGKTQEEQDASQDGTQPLPQEHGQNFFLMAFYHICMRTGWIFKTESIIMPAVVDLIGGQGWLRGCLPMLNRFGQSIPPLLASDKLRNTRIKKNWLTICTCMMGTCFLLLSLIWWITEGKPSWWLPIAFLCVYALFFACTGINQLVFSTITGKLIVPRRRGKLMLVSNTIGAASAVAFALFLLTKWLREDSGNFVMIFGFTGAAFIFAGILTTFLKEPEDIPTGTRRNGLDLFKMSFATLVIDKNFRRLAMIAGLFGMSTTLIPHYQALGRGRLELGLTAMIPWLVAQNIGAALFSIPAGWAGDRFGYRAVLRVLMIAACIAPVLAIVLSWVGNSSRPIFICVFCLLGLTPVTMRSLNNYTLEIVASKYHPRYLSTLSLCMAIPVILSSSLLGAVVDWLSYEAVFGFVFCLLIVGWLLTFGLQEPRESGQRESHVAKTKTEAN